MIAEGGRLIEQGCQRVGHIQPPQYGEGHPATAGFARYRPITETQGTYSSTKIR